jgi:hypothetical protein
VSSCTRSCSASIASTSRRRSKARSHPSGLCPGAAGRSSQTRVRELTLMNEQPSTATSSWLSSSLASIARISATSSRRGVPPPSGRIARRPPWSTHQNAPSARCLLGRGRDIEGGDEWPCGSTYEQPPHDRFRCGALSNWPPLRRRLDQSAVAARLRLAQCIAPCARWSPGWRSTAPSMAGTISGSGSSSSRRTSKGPPAQVAAGGLAGDGMIAIRW